MKETHDITQYEDNEKLKPNRQYKDSVFVDLFSLDEKTRYDAVRQIYNAFHNEKITRKEEIRFVRLENVLFRKVRNDVSFVANNRLLILLEHQSTVNENMPFRCLEYVVALYQAEMKARDKFSQTPMTLLAPEFYVIYNGASAYPAMKELKLSSLFKDSEKTPQLELKVTVININHPDNKDFLDKCNFLKGYGKLERKVRRYRELYGERGYIIAIEECIKEDMELVEYLKRKMREVSQMFSAEYSYELELEASKEDGIREGMKRGIERGSYTKAIETAKNLIEMGLSREDIVKATGLAMEELTKL